MGKEILMKMIVIKKDHLSKMLDLMAKKMDNAYITLYEKDGYRTICQYSQKYDNLHIVTLCDKILSQSNKVCMD